MAIWQVPQREENKAATCGLIVGPAGALPPPPLVPAPPVATVLVVVKIGFGKPKPPHVRNIMATMPPLIDSTANGLRVTDRAQLRSYQGSSIRSKTRIVGITTVPTGTQGPEKYFSN